MSPTILYRFALRLPIATALALAPLATPAKAANLDYLSFEPFIAIEELPSPWARSVFQDRHGYVWVPTNNNLIRFDGHRVEVFESNSTLEGSISSSIPITLANDAIGNLWISSPQGLHRFDYEQELFENYPLVDESGESLSRSAQVLLPLHNGQLLLGTLSGLFLFDPIERQWTDKFPGIGAPETRFKDAFELEPGRVIAATAVNEGFVEAPLHGMIRIRIAQVPLPENGRSVAYPLEVIR